TAPRAEAPRGRRSSRAGERERKERDREAFRDLESQLSAETLEIKVSEDGLTATVARIGDEDGVETILAELKRQEIRVGIDTKAIEAAVRRAAGGAAQYDVVVARGTPPEIRAPAHVRHHLPEALCAAGEDTPFGRLKQALAAPNLEPVNEWNEPCALVHKGELLAEVVPADAVPGQTVRGDETPPDPGAAPELAQSEHVILSEDGRRCMAAIYGYAGLIEGQAAVLVPLWVSPDNMEARFVCLPPDAPAPTAEELAELFKARWIEHGAHTENLDKIRQILERGRALPRAVLVARGTRPDPGREGQVQCLVPPAELPPWKQLQSLLNLKDRAGLEAGLTELCGAERAAPFRAVGPGDVLAERVPARQGTAGRDVLGEELLPAEVEEVELAIGDNVAVDKDGLHARATCYGYLALYGSAQISVVSPLWLSGDRMTLAFLNLPQGGMHRYPSVEELAQLVAEDGHLEGAEVGAWEGLRARLAAGELTDPLVVLAHGTPPTPGREPRFEWAVTMAGRAGTLLDDGSIDLRDRRLITVVKEGDLLGRLVPGAPGQPGRDALGHELAAPAYAELEVGGDSRIRSEIEGDEGVTAYYALANGGVNSLEEKRQSRGSERRRLRLSLFAISEIAGDVDYSIGHVDFQGDVVIKGSVRALFRVKASGSVTIGESVEPGARIEAGGDILVTGGVMGGTTELIAGGGVIAKFVQEAQVRAGGDIEVAAYIHEASVRTAGAVKVAGAGEGGGRALVGGMAWGARGIETPSLGSPSNPRIRLVAGIDPARVEQTEMLRSRIRACEAREAQALEGLGLRQLDMRLIKQKARQLDGDKRQALLEWARQLAEHAELRRDLETRLKALAEAQRELARTAAIVVSGPVVAGAELRIGEHVLKVEQDATNVRFHLLEEDGEVRLQADGL
ncbi:MAG: flagellar assembly protein A, partial [Gemmatimonadota bacterium]